jgi:hypothetical protein
MKFKHKNVVSLQGKQSKNDVRSFATVTAREVEEKKRVIAHVFLIILDPDIWRNRPVQATFSENLTAKRGVDWH